MRAFRFSIFQVGKWFVLWKIFLKVNISPSGDTIWIVPVWEGTSWNWHPTENHCQTTRTEGWQWFLRECHFILLPSKTSIADMYFSANRKRIIYANVTIRFIVLSCGVLKSDWLGRSWWSVLLTLVLATHLATAGNTTNC